MLAGIDPQTGGAMENRTRLTLALAASVAAAASAAAVRAADPPAQTLRSTAWDWTSLQTQATKVGERRNVVDAPTPTLQRLEMHITTLRPGETSHPPHRHPEEELIIVKEGTVLSLVGGQERKLGPGSVILQASNELHGLRNVGDTNATYHVILWRTAATPPKEPTP
jgi:XRE family transcriptional regulator, regulator of sulfur utilization